MASINDEIRISAPIDQVYAALTRQAGYRGWWNAVAEVPDAVGGEAQLHFVKEGTPINMRFRIDAEQANEQVRWTCIGHDMPSWIGTTLTWSLASSGSDVLVRFEHGGWKESAPEAVAQGWKHFIGSLKSYVETGKGQPW